MKICSIASGSRGNSTWIKAGETEVLVDIGVNMKRLNLALREIETEAKNIAAIFITHEHDDHIRGLKDFCKKHINVKVFVNSKLLFAAPEKFIDIKNNICAFNSQDFYFGEITIAPFEVSHDSLCCNGFAFYHQGHKFSIVTDCGEICDKGIESLKKSDLVFIESNYDEEMLMNGKYPEWLKKRIFSKNGHLSNKFCAEVIKKLAKQGTKRFVLCHLSENNNKREIARKESEDALAAFGDGFKVDLTWQNIVSKIYEV